MTRQRISFTEPKDERLKAQVDQLKTKLEQAERSGFTEETKEQILARSKSVI